MSVQRSNCNVGFGEYNRWHPLINCFTHAQRPLPPSTTKASPYLDLTFLGFPFGTAGTTVGASETVYIRGNADKSAITVVMKWTGDVSVTATSFTLPTSITGGDARTRNGITWSAAKSNNSSRTGRFTFALSGKSAYQSVITVKGDATAAGAGQFTEFVVCRADEEDAYDDARFAGKYPELIFSPYMITELKSFTPSAIRFMDAQFTNTSMLSQWADRPPLGQMTLHQNRKTNLVNGTGNPGELGQSGDAYFSNSGSKPAGDPVHGECVTCAPLVNNATTSPTFKQDNQNAKPLWSAVSAYPIAPIVPLAAPFTNNQTGFVADTLYTLVYDQNVVTPSGKGAWLFTPGGALTGYPLEMLIEMCNVAGFPGWFCMPAYADDDFLLQFANLLASTYTPSVVYIEEANEVWNVGIGFVNTARYDAAGQNYFTSPQIGTGSQAAVSAWYGKRIKRLKSIMGPVLGTKLKVVMAGQGAAGDIALSLQNQIENLRLQNTNYQELSDGAWGNNAPWHSADVLSYAFYFRPFAMFGDANDLGWNAISNASTLKTHVDAYAADNTYTAGFDYCKTQFIGDTQLNAYLTGGRFNNWNNLAVKYGIEIRHYEFNHQIAAPSTTFCAANAPWSDGSYGGTGGKIYNFLIAFFESQQYTDTFAYVLSKFYGYSRSVAGSHFALCGADPWQDRAKSNPTADQLVSSEIVETRFGNWNAHVAQNSQTTRSLTVTN